MVERSLMLLSEQCRWHQQPDLIAGMNRDERRTQRNLRLAKRNAAKQARDVAAELLELYAQRAAGGSFWRLTHKTFMGKTPNYEGHPSPLIRLAA